MATVKKGDKVEWKYGKGTAEGTVTEVHKDDVSRQIQGKTIKRKASPKEPAVVVSQGGSKKVVKSASEVSKK